MPWLLVEGQRKMLTNFAMVIRVDSFRELGKINSFLMSLFPMVITKEIFKRNVTLTSFVGRIAIIGRKR